MLPSGVHDDSFQSQERREIPAALEDMQLTGFLWSWNIGKERKPEPWTPGFLKRVSRRAGNSTHLYCSPNVQLFERVRFGVVCIAESILVPLKEIVCRWCGIRFYLCRSCWRDRRYCSDMCREASLSATCLWVASGRARRRTAYAKRYVHAGSQGIAKRIDFLLYNANTSHPNDK